MNELLNKTLSQIVTENYQAARVFEKYGLDFCCKGKRPLTDALTEKQIDSSLLVNELTEAIALPNTASDFNKMSLTELAEYIVRVHHTYVKINMPQILSYVLRVATKHGERFPYMKEVYILLAELKEEMDQHMVKEEKVLFPRIKLLEISQDNVTNLEFLSGPISVMEHEHDNAGTIMQQIRELTNNYEAPETACTTFRLALSALEGFEHDLHQHVHLENNILFPRSVELYKSLNDTVLN
jgi:regulator of cell morphogenesis and NO signaling